MIANLSLIEVYKSERHARYRNYPRFNWRLILGKNSFTTGPGYDTYAEAYAAAQLLHGHMPDSEVICLLDQVEDHLRIYLGEQSSPGNEDVEPHI